MTPEDTVRSWIHTNHAQLNEHLGSTHVTERRRDDAVAALDVLVAERDALAARLAEAERR